MLPDALADVIGEQLAEHKREADRIIEGLRTEARAVISELEAKIAKLEVANEMLRVEARHRVDEELAKVKDAAALIKDGQPGPAGKDADPEAVAALVLSRLPSPEKGDPGKDADEEAIVERILERLPKPRDGKDADPDQIRQMVCEEVAKLPDPEPGRDGKDADPEAVAAIVQEYVERAVAALPEPEPGRPGRDGKDVDPEHVEKLVVTAVDKAIKALPPPAKGDPGKDAVVDYERIDVMIGAKIAALPPPEKGDKGDMPEPELVRKLIAEEVAKLPPAPQGKDGVGLSGALINRAGECILTLTDGTVHNLGMVVGRDGEPGKPGQDGFGFDHLEFEHDGGRTLIFRFIKGDRVKEFSAKVPFVFDAGIYREGQSYEKGDGVTFGGSWWVAQQDTTEKPGDGSKAWRLVAKRGRDGKDGAPGMKGDKGDPGRPGRDFTPGGSR